MTEEDWLTCAKATQPIMDWLRRRGSDRKFYLVSVAVLRLIGDQLPDERYRELILLIEKHADGQCNAMELGRNQRAAEDDAFARFLVLGERERNSKRNRRAQAAAAAAAHAAIPGNGWHSACNAVHEAVGAGERATLWPPMCAILRDIFGNPFRPIQPDRNWQTRTVRGLAEGIYEERCFDRLPILGDALEDAGCNNTDILNHCRQPGEHVRGCWVVDLLLGKE